MGSADNENTLLNFEELIQGDSESSDKKIKLGNTRVTGKEQYYTPFDTAQEIFKNLIEMVPNLSTRTFIEPAGGTGAFINAALEVGITEIISFDIEPHHKKITLGDFLEQEIPKTGLLTITNPPFGRNNSLSIPFFNKAAEVSDLIVFVVQLICFYSLFIKCFGFHNSSSRWIIYFEKIKKNNEQCYVSLFKKT
jgi:predicted RNA methylase